MKNGLHIEYGLATFEDAVCRNLSHSEVEWEAIVEVVSSTERLVDPWNVDLFSIRPMPIPVVQQPIMSIVFLVDLYKAYAKTSTATNAATSPSPPSSVS